MTELAKKRRAELAANSPALKLLKEMFKRIAEKHHSGRESWEILIEVLGQHLGIVRQPFLYANPELDVETYEDLSPLHRSAFYVQWPKYDPLRELLGLPPKLTRPLIYQPDPRHPHYTSYFDRNTKTRLKLQKRRYPSRQGSDAEFFVKRFTDNGLLEAYVMRARAESFEDVSENICAGVDHLGAIFEEYMLGGRKNRLGQMLTPVNVFRMICQMNMGLDRSKKVASVLDPALGTGRFLIYASLEFPFKPMVLFGVEVDLTLYRVALVNMALYSNHPYSILCADSLRLNDVEYPEVWDLGNQWDPPDMTPYYYSADSPKKLSFEEYVRLKKQREQDMKELGIAESKPKVIASAPLQFNFVAYARARKAKQ